MKRWWLILVLVLSLGVNIGIVGTLVLKSRTAPAERLPELGPGLPRALEQVADHLRLEGEPRERFLELHRRFVMRTRELLRRSRELQQEMRRQLSARRPDEEALRAALEQRTKLFAEREALLAQTILESRRLLGPRKGRVYLRLLRRLGPILQQGANPGAMPRMRPGGPWRPGAQGSPGSQRPPSPPADSGAADAPSVPR